MSARNPRDEQDFRIVQDAGGEPSQLPSQLADEPLVRAVNALPLPCPILPPPPVKDDVKSALSGAQMIYELRSALENFRSDGSERLSEEHSQETSMEQDPFIHAADGAASASANISKNVETGQRSNDRLSRNLEQSQDMWARIVLDECAVKGAIDGLSGGDALRNVLDEQERLASLVMEVKAVAERVQRSMQAAEKEASRTRKALETLERLRMAAADVQDGLEYGVATANILGAAHFAHDDELRSFKDFLRHNPPCYTD